MAQKSNKNINAGLPAAELLSFLKDTRSASTWTERDLVTALNLNREQAKQTLAALQLQGYAEPIGHDGQWRTTEAGELVSGGKTPRFTRESVEHALADLKERIKSVNEDASAPYRINSAVAFGDFLTDRARVQAVEVGVELQRRTISQDSCRQTATEHAQTDALLKQLRGKSTMLHVQRYVSWMSHRSHRNLL